MSRSSRKVSIFTKDKKNSKSAMLKRSMSLVSASDKENLSPQASEAAISPLDFDQFFPWTCAKMGADGQVLVTRTAQEIYKKTTKKKIEIIVDDDAIVSSPVTARKSERAWGGGGEEAGSRVIPVEAKYDARDALVELLVKQNNFLTQLHVKILKICLTFQTSLTKLTITKCKLTQEVLYELSQLLKSIRIIDLVLDETYNRQGNFYVLLEYKNSLKRLSLNRCSINDAVGGEIFKRIKDPLQILELAGNFITDKCVRILGKILRSNRSLIHINLSSNAVSDEGMLQIMKPLKKFELSKTELQDLSRRKMDYFWLRQVCYDEQKKLAETRSLQYTSKKSGKTALPRTRSAKSLDKQDKKHESVQTIVDSVAEKLTRKLMGVFEDVFDESNIKIEDQKVYCYGNFKLSSINLSYNNLTHYGVNEILKVLKYQQASSEALTGEGLIRVLINGNNLCEECSVQNSINDYINRKITRICGPIKTTKKGDCRWT